MYMYKSLSSRLGSEKNSVVVDKLNVPISQLSVNLQGSTFAASSNRVEFFFEDDQSILIETMSFQPLVFFKINTTQKGFTHGATANLTRLYGNVFPVQ